MTSTTIAKEKKRPKNRSREEERNEDALAKLPGVLPTDFVQPHPVEVELARQLVEGATVEGGEVFDEGGRELLALCIE